MIIIMTALITGTLDCAAALLLFRTRTHQNPKILLQYIASAALGPKAFTKEVKAGNATAALGLAAHYLIAAIWTVIYFALIPTILPCGAIGTNAIIYGLFVWTIMNLVVLPLSKAEPRPFSPALAIINIIILILTIGLPCAWLSN